MAALSACVVAAGACTGDVGERAAPLADEPQPGQPSENRDEVGDDDGSMEPPVSDKAPEDPAADHQLAPAPAPGYDVDDHDALADAKQLASDVVSSLMTYEPDDTPHAIVGRATAEVLSIADPDDLARAAGPLHHRGAWSRGEIVYPQLGGESGDRASVMVVARQTVGFADGTVTEQIRTLDVRVVRDGHEWAFERLASAGGVPRDRPDDLPAVATAVLADDRIDLPDTAVWDIYRGRISPALLALMSRIADRTPYAVSVLDTGHPWEVFGTDRQSKHTMGYAVDIYRLDGRRVIDERAEGTAVHAFVEWVYDQPELSEVGSPWALDGFGGRSFTDLVHQDHVHVGIALKAP